MNPILEQIELGISKSLKIKRYAIQHFNFPYHFHPEIEIVLIVSSFGKVFVRNGMTPFSPGDLFIFGSNVPHLFVSDQSFHSSGEKNVEVILIQFSPQITTESLLMLPELKNVSNLLKMSEAGIKFSAPIHKEVDVLMAGLSEQSRFERLIQVMSILNNLECSSQAQLIDRLPDQDSSHLKQPDRIQNVNRFLVQNYNRDITLDEVATLANMNKASFCRYFKTHTFKTFSEYLNELRTDYASKLLIEGSLSISEICYEVGYNNLPYFIKQFKKFYTLSPKQFRIKNSY